MLMYCRQCVLRRFDLLSLSVTDRGPTDKIVVYRFLINNADDIDTAVRIQLLATISSYSSVQL